MPTWFEVFALAGALIALGAFAMTMANLRRLPRPDAADEVARLTAMSVAIPARNEAENIEACIESVLAGGMTDVRVLVYDDQSDDGTGAILQRLSSEDERIVVVPTQPMPAGWCGKQHACWCLARHAAAMEGAHQDDWILFIDADVRIEKDGLARTVHHARSLDGDGKLGLISTFPRQITRSLGEAMLVTSIFFILLSYLPFGRMRKTLDPSASAACGQFVLVKHRCYESFGGHESLKSSMHDGVKMPRLARRAGFRTDLFDGADIASCRMYDGFQQAWRGFAKNAYEGLGSLVLLVFLTAMHLVGHIAPPLVLAIAIVDAMRRGEPSWIAITASAVALGLGILQRLIIAIRQRHTPAAAPLHAVSVLLMTMVQWRSWYLDRTGKRSWRGRTLEGVSA